jgi:hypothetical protein
MATKALLAPQADMSVQDKETIFLFTPETEEAKQWIAEHVKFIEGETMYFGEALVVEHRYGADLSAGMASDGLKLQT